jgi:uncharacterized protein YegL
MKELDEVFDDIKASLGVRLKNYVTILLDSSGSMDVIKKEAREMFNEQIKVLKETKGNMETYISLVTFGTAVNKPIIWCGNVDDVKEINEKDYFPSGGTALYDAVGKTVTKLMKIPDYNDDNTSFLMIIISDGEENSSQFYDTDKISKLVKKVQKTKKWTFTYLGSKTDLASVKKVFHLSEGNICGFSGYTGKSGFTGVSNNAANATAYYMSSRSMGNTTVDDFYSNDTITKSEENKPSDTN